MKFLLKHGIGLGASLMLAFTSVCPTTATVYAADVESMENQSSELKNELSGINAELLSIGNKIADVEEKIEMTNNDIERTQEQLAIAKRSEAQQYEEMKMRIKYMYENGDTTLLEMIFQVENMSDFLNKVDFIQNISQYDRDKLEELHELQVAIAGEEESLSEDKASQEKLEKELASQKDTLKAKAEETSMSLSELQGQIEKLRAEEEKKKEEAKKAEEARKAKEAQEAKKSEKKDEDSKEASGSEINGSSSSDSKYDMPSGDGVLTKYKGVNYFQGHRETYYSQKVLPGHGLNIPGRHVASDGTIRDEDGYICVASSDYPKGTVVETSLGMGKVYDSGCASGTIDIYTDW